MRRRFHEPVVDGSQQSFAALKSERAGFIDAPQHFPAATQSMQTVAPIAHPAIPRATRQSVATAMMTNIKKNVKTNSL